MESPHGLAFQAELGAAMGWRAGVAGSSWALAAAAAGNSNLLNFGN